jgi:hypothetical protein
VQVDAQDRVSPQPAAVGGGVARPPTAPPRRADARAGALPAERVVRPEAGRLVDLAIFALLITVALWVDGHAVRHTINLLDEGFEYQLAARILQGQVPYRDMFTVVTPGAFYWQALLIAVFGPGLLVGRISTALAGAGIAAATYAAGRKLAGRPLALVAALLTIPWGIPFWPTPNYSWYVVLLALGATWAALWAVDGGARRWVVAGLLAAGAVVTKQNVGLGTAAVLGVYALWRGGRRAALAYGLALAAPVAALVLYLGMEGALPAFWYQTVWFAWHVFPGAAHIPYPTPHQVARALQRSGAAGLQALVTYLPHAVLAAGLPVLAAGALARRPWLPEAVLAWGVTLAGLTIAYPRSDFVHIDYALPTAFLGLAWLLWRLVALGLPRLLPLPLLLALSLLSASWPLGNRFSPRDVPIPGVPLAAGIRVDPGTAAAVHDAVAGIDRYAPPGTPVLVLPWAAMLYYLADRPNPTPYDLDITLNMPPAGNAEIAAAMLRTHCPVFYWPNAGISRPFESYGAPVLAVLHSHYRPVGRAGPLEVWLWQG